MQTESELYLSNLHLNRAEFGLRRLHLSSMPRYLSVVLGTACNLDCPYCYQARSSENLLAPAPFGVHLRRELAAYYPYLSTLRIGGGEVFVIPGFEELVEDVSVSVRRPIISISTNGSLIGGEWAEKIVSTPFQEVTVSIDGAKPETYARLRRGASLDEVLANVDRIQNLKERHNSKLPDVNFFFLVMRSNYREIPDFLKLAKDHGIEQVSFQMLLVDQRNLGREPWLRTEIDFEPQEVRELHDLARRSIVGGRREFRRINVSGLHSLFQKHFLDTDFLEESRFSIYPGRDQADPEPAVRNEIELCPNPWTLLFVTENGDVHLCFGAPPIGNLYEAPLTRLWNSPKAMAARSEIIDGRYDSAGCARIWCSWREGKKSDQPVQVNMRGLIDQFQKLTRQALATPESAAELPGDPSLPASVRRMLAEHNGRIAELEGQFVGLCEKNRLMLEAADKENQRLAARIVELERNDPLPAAVHFGRNSLVNLLKRCGIGAAIRSIQALQRFVNWVARTGSR